MLNHTGISLKTNKSIKMHGEWAIALVATKAAVLYAYPHHSQEFSEYEKYVMGQFAAFVNPSQHQRIIHFNYAIHLCVACSNDLSLD